MAKSNHKYRVSVYLGKEIYEDLEKISRLMGISVATLAKIMLNTGYEMSKALEKDFKMKGEHNNGKE